jgi:hypothetical protein
MVHFHSTTLATLLCINTDLLGRRHYLELKPAIFENRSVAPGHCALDFYGATDGIDRTRKFDKSAVTREVDEFAAASLEGSESTFLVIARQRAVAGDIGRHDSSRSKLAQRRSV